jgi:hypothetical protein
LARGLCRSECRRIPDCSSFVASWSKILTTTTTWRSGHGEQGQAPEHSTGCSVQRLGPASFAGASMFGYGAQSKSWTLEYHWKRLLVRLATRAPMPSRRCFGASAVIPRVFRTIDSYFASDGWRSDFKDMVAVRPANLLALCRIYVMTRALACLRKAKYVRSSIVFGKTKQFGHLSL